MKILCMCGKNIGYEIANYLLDSNHEVSFVVNDYERLGEWYRTPRELPINEISEKQIIDYRPDLIIVAFYDKILKDELFAVPQFGAWNLHLGDAEKYRGAYPNIWALMNGDQTYSVTLHRINEGVDTGDILRKSEFHIPDDFTGIDLYYKMVDAGRMLFVDCFDDLVSGNALKMTRHQNNHGVVTHYRKELSREVKVPDIVKNHVRALTFPPFPPAFFMVGNRKFVITEESAHTTRL